jgi:hypothetical protein
MYGQSRDIHVDNVSSHPVFSDIRIAQSFVFCIVFSEPFFVFLSFFF